MLNVSTFLIAKLFKIIRNFKEISMIVNYEETSIKLLVIFLL